MLIIYRQIIYYNEIKTPTFFHNIILRYNKLLYRNYMYCVLIFSLIISTDKTIDNPPSIIHNREMFYQKKQVSYHTLLN